MTNNPVNSRTNPTYFEPSPFKLVALTAIIMAICILSGGVFVYTLAQSQAKTYTDEQIAMVKNQAQITLQPMILAKDSVSMNVYLRTLSQANFINGLSLVNAKRQLLSRAGDSLGDIDKKQIFSQQLEIGELTLFINRAPAKTFFNQLLWVFMVLAATTSIFSLIAIAIIAKNTMRQFSEQYKPLLEHRFSMELAQLHVQESEILANAKAEQSSYNSEENDETKPVPIDAPELLENQEPKEAAPNAVSLAIVDLDSKTPTESMQSSDANEGGFANTAPSQQDDHEQNQALVSLLKPDSQQRMPHFKPFNDNPEGEGKTKRATKTSPATPTIELIEEDLSTATKTKENPLLRSHPHEEQLDLYSLEHQTELNLKAKDAAYLLFIDCSSGRAPIEDPEEHKELLAQYRRLIKLVTNIYGGHVELLASGDIRVMFDDKDPDDNHGIQSLCAAKLFNQLYKLYNHRQITRMQPTLNIQLSLVRGNREKLEILREEAHFLTRTTISNELISHTPLSEIQALKDSLLSGAQTERQEEDKILILKLDPSYQELLEKQARHLVKGI